MAFVRKQALLTQRCFKELKKEKRKWGVSCSGIWNHFLLLKNWMEPPAVSEEGSSRSAEQSMRRTRLTAYSTLGWKKKICLKGQLPATFIDSSSKVNIRAVRRTVVPEVRRLKCYTSHLWKAFLYQWQKVQWIIINSPNHWRDHTHSVFFRVLLGI